MERRLGCLACQRVHIVNPFTGRLMFEETRNRDQVAKGSRISNLSRRIIPKLSDRPKAANLEAAAQEREPRLVALC